jgi:hypothetical protein
MARLNWPALQGTLVVAYYLWRWLSAPALIPTVAFFWGGPISGSLNAAWWSALVIAGILLWTRARAAGLLLLAITHLILLKANPAAFWGWGWLLTPLLFFSLLRHHAPRATMRAWAGVIFVLYVLSIYWVPFWDRLLQPAWFNGHVMRYLLAHYGRGPWLLEPHGWQTLAGQAALYFELVVPLLYCWPRTRRASAWAMASFHLLLALLAELQIWNPLMVLVWLELAYYPPRFPRGGRIALAGLLLLTTLHARRFPWRPIPLVSRALDQVGLLSFHRMTMFTNFDMPIQPVRVSFTRANVTEDIRGDHRWYFLKLFFGFTGNRPRDPQIFCDGSPVEVRASNDEKSLVSSAACAPQ